MATIQRWCPRDTMTTQENVLMARLAKHRKLFGFLREHRAALFDEAFLDSLSAMYRQSGAGKEPVCPGLMAMAMLLQGYDKVSDKEAVERTVIDLRWQMVLDCLGAKESAFSQGAFQEFRQRMIRNDLDQRLLERTVELARTSGAFDFRKLPTTLRVAMDSMPLEGAGRVEDTINLLAHAGRKVVQCAAKILDWTAERVCQEAGAPLLAGSSVKASLDRSWGNPNDRNEAVNQLIDELTSLDEWLKRRLPDEVEAPSLSEHLETVQKLIAQDLEPDPNGSGSLQIREGVAVDRRVSIEDKEMRHGRKSKSKKFNGYKRHIAVDLDTMLIVACAVAPANRPEEESAAELARDMKFLDRKIGSLNIDRGYINAPLVDEVANDNGEINCRPWVPRNGKFFSKALFRINIRNRTITCPEGQTVPVKFGSTVEFDAEQCGRCSSRSKCTDASAGQGRTVAIAKNEARQKRLQKLVKTPAGRAKLRERVSVEHSLAHAGRRQGKRARYWGVRRNLWDWRRAAAITNLETIDRQLDLGAARWAA